MIKFPWNHVNPNKLTQKDDQRLFRRVFLSPDGLEVLRILLHDWSYFTICDTEQKRALNDYAKIFLHDHLGMSKITVYTEFDTSEDKE
jgi:hypothetical protein